MIKYTCNSCGQPCEGVFADFGLGPVEFWGVKSHDSHMQFVSDCCEEMMLDGYGNEVEHNELDEEE